MVCEHGTLDSNSSFCKSNPCLRGRHGLVSSVRFDEWKRQVASHVDTKILTMVEPEEVEMLASPPTQAFGNQMQRSASFRILRKRVQMTLSCEKAVVQHLVTTGKCYQNRPDGDDGWVTMTFFCCEYFEFSSMALVAYPTGDNYRTNHGSSYCETSWRHGWQVAIPSICKRGDTTYVVILRETGRFLNEIHNHYGEVRSSKELLDNLQESKEGKPYEESKVTVATSKLGQPSVRRKLVQSLSPLFQTSLLFNSGNWSLRMRKSGLQFMLIQDVDVTWQFLFPKQSRPCYDKSIKTNESLVVRDIGSLSNQYWWECLHMKEREISVTKRGNKRFLKPAQSIELSTVQWRWNCDVFLKR